MDEDDFASPSDPHPPVRGQPVDPRTRADVAVFRRAERARLYGARKAISVADRAASETVLAAALDRLLTDLSERVVAAYWPIRGEPDLR